MEVIPNNEAEINNTRSSPPRIQALEKEVVDRIAAGEVVQRPASIAKELIENALDAQATKIEISAGSGGLGSLTITDDGNGFHPDDLKLAATRFATSKLARFDDLKSIKTFGFRGEALASCSMVGRLSIISKRRSHKGDSANGIPNKRKNNHAYRMSYLDGKPKGQATPSAGKEGTQVKVEDLFYNLPSRRRAFEGSKKENEEYYKILSVIQRYAVHCSRDGIGFVCRKKGGVTDLNTVSLPALKQIQKLKNNDSENKNDRGENCSSLKDMIDNTTKQTIGHVFGSELTRELLVFRSSKGDLNAVEADSLKELLASGSSSSTTMATETCNTESKNTQNQSKYLSISIEADKDHSKLFDTFAYTAFGMCTNATYSPKIKSSTAFILFINNRLVESAPIRRAIEGVYSEILPRGVKPFVYLSLQLPGLQLDVNIHPTKREVAILHEEKLCHALAESMSDLLRSVETSKIFYTQALLPNASRAHNTRPTKNKREQSEIETDDNKISNDDKAVLRNESENPKKKKITHAKHLIRIDVAAEKGSMEPFLETGYKNQSPNEKLKTSSSILSSQSGFQHKSDCEFSSKNESIDMNVPGAFALICRCQIDSPGLPSLPNAATRNNSVVRPKKIKPTICSYTSIESLRNDISDRAHDEISSKLRESVFVGCVSRHRSLLQSGIELLIVNHNELAKELFYQLSLNQFGCFETASLGSDGVNVGELVETALRFEDAQNLINRNIGKSNKIDSKFSFQIVECLQSHAEMLEEYFSIRFKRINNHNDSSQFVLMLTGLPIILQGHSPSPHALPMFLLRLATQVDWTQETECFDGICTELGYYYAEIASDCKSDFAIDGLSEVAKKLVQHVLFPAFRFHLIPPKEFASDGSFTKLAALSKLYKVFERC